MLPGSGQKVCGGWVVCKPSLVFSFDFGQAEQKEWSMLTLWLCLSSCTRERSMWPRRSSIHFCRLQRKGLTQNSSNTIHQPLKAGFVPKKSKSCAALAQEPSPIGLNGSIKSLHKENDVHWIQEIVPVKTESAGENLDTNTLAASTIGNQDMENTAMVENIVSYGEDFGELDDYNEEGNSFEQSGMQDNTETPSLKLLKWRPWLAMFRRWTRVPL